MNIPTAETLILHQHTRAEDIRREGLNQMNIILGRLEKDFVQSFNEASFSVKARTFQYNVPSLADVAILSLAHEGESARSDRRQACEIGYAEAKKLLLANIQEKGYRACYSEVGGAVVIMLNWGKAPKE